ncbi:hypothetical protein GQ53DRAFT_777139 [Thozetella sp. PMI_491]|nr:hypothetical protein GQ53DRAFT_777139 [Thozetella sp. PMI_491]
MAVFLSFPACKSVSLGANSAIKPSFTGKRKNAMLTVLLASVLNQGGMRQSTKQFNGSFFKQTVFRQPAGPEVDDAWESLGCDCKPSVVPEIDALGAGLSESHMRVSEKYGGGYIANVEGLHHLHCLNLLRKSLYFNVDYYRALGKEAFSNEEYVLRLHITHCLDTLRQQLMCTVDVGLLGQVWWNREQPRGFPDFNTEHTCRDFEAVRRWAEEHQAPEEQKQPEGYLRAPRKGDVLESIP